MFKQKKMENQYFIPDKKDLYLGYEYEEFLPNLGVWDKKTITELTNDRDGSGGFADIEFLIDENKNIRVSYLTKEQIEKEGWEYRGDNTDIYFFRKGDLMLDFTPKGYGKQFAYNISIGEDLYYPMYNGQCKSINEFRIICKLLNIK